MELRGIGIAIILAGLVVMGSGIFLGSLETAYPATAQNVTSNANFTALNKTNEMATIADETLTTIQTQVSSGVEILDVPYLLLTGATQSLKLILTTLDVGIGLIGGLGNLTGSFGLSIGWVFAGIAAILMLIIAYEGVSILLKTKV